MKKIFILLNLFFVFFTPLNALENDLLYRDLDSIFDGENISVTDSDSVSSVLEMLNSPGLVIRASYEFQGLISPGWDMAPWYFNGDEQFSPGPGARMLFGLGFDSKISESFRANINFSYVIPGTFSVGDFFFDYNILNNVFIRAGKFEHSWGISPNYGFTNLLIRIPPHPTGAGDSYIFRVDVPIGIGGFQVLALTRDNLLNAEMNMSKSSIGTGAKYNLALRRADFDLGFFYHEGITNIGEPEEKIFPVFRSFLSAKTTLWNTELYNEWLVAANIYDENKTSFAVNLGFSRSFLNNNLTVNGEFFFNGEGNTFFYQPETNIQDADEFPLIDGLNLAFNLLYKAGGKNNLRFFTKILYKPSESSAQVVPGFRLTPLSNIDINFAVPMALGPKDGFYYLNPMDPDIRLNKTKPRPFIIMLLITVSEKVQGEIR